jgi:hypothetical protein
VCVSLYWNSLQCGFVFDDMSAVRDNRYDLCAVSEKKLLLEPVVRRKLTKETKKSLEKVVGEKESHKKVFSGDKTNKKERVRETNI